MPQGHPGEQFTSDLRAQEARGFADKGKMENGVDDFVDNCPFHLLADIAIAPQIAQRCHQINAFGGW